MIVFSFLSHVQLVNRLQFNATMYYVDSSVVSNKNYHFLFMNMANTDGCKAKRTISLYIGLMKREQMDSYS